MFNFLLISSFTYCINIQSSSFIWYNMKYMLCVNQYKYPKYTTVTDVSKIFKYKRKFQHIHQIVDTFTVFCITQIIISGCWAMVISVKYYTRCFGLNCGDHPQWWCFLCLLLFTGLHWSRRPQWVTEDRWNTLLRIAFTVETKKFCMRFYREDHGSIV